jgi:threonine dehydrogenase-like Zn-dependent dehydrogenase
MMHALTVLPGTAESVRLDVVPEPSLDEGSVLIRALALGVCGTDREIVAGEYGWAPPGRDRLILGHESLGRVEEAPPESGLAPGDLVVGIVRHPDPVPCENCAVGEWDMCRNGLYSEHGIKQLHGFGAEQFRLSPEFAVRVDPALGNLGVLLEPASVLAKAWEHIERIGRRALWEPRRVLVTGAGPIGLLAALLGVQRGLQVHVLDRVTEGPKPGLVRDLGATYHATGLDTLGFEPDIVIECTGAPAVVIEVMGRTARNGIVCLAGVSSGGRRTEVDAGMLNRTMVLENDVVFGSVNANRRHYEQAAGALAEADRAWLGRLITRRVPLHRWAEALEPQPGDVKTVIDFTLPGTPPVQP